MDTPIYMLNALWFKKDGGKEKYLEYARAVVPLIKGTGGEVTENYAPEEMLIGEWDPDVFFVVMYPSQAVFDSMTNSSAFDDIKHLREEALEKSLLVRCNPMKWR